jgi:lipoprotein-anchoring transpeptidase ErfK/SrfK
MDDAVEVTPQQKRLALLVTVAFALIAVALGALVLKAFDSDPAEAEPVATTTTLPPTTTTTTAPEPQPVVPVATALATPNGTIPVFDGPNGMQVRTTGFWYGYPQTMPIVEDQGAWLRIMLPERPNGSTGWVRREDVAVSSTAYRIVIRLPETRLYVYKDGFELFSAPVGIGKDSTPTAPGSFYVAVIEKPGPHGYGPIVLDTSGHSEAIRSWQGMGDAITAIHGPISASSDAQIGTTGARISNGCIRMHEVDQLKLDVIPLGTPVDIVA